MYPLGNAMLPFTFAVGSANPTPSHRKVKIKNKARVQGVLNQVNVVGVGGLANNGGCEKRIFPNPMVLEKEKGFNEEGLR